MGKLRILGMLTALALILSCFSGCWDYREIEKLAIVAGMAADRDEERDIYIITVEVLNSQIAKDGTETRSTVVTGEGKTIFDAVRNIIILTGTKLYWSHCKVVVIGQEMARDGITPVADWISRLIETRPDIWVLVSTEKTAGEILKNKAPMQEVTSYFMEDLFESQKEIPRFPDAILFELLGDLSSEGVSIILPRVELISGINGGGQVPRIFGAAVFFRDKMVGQLDGLETRNIMWVREGAEGGVVTEYQQEGDGHVDISLEVASMKVEKIPKFIDGKPAMQVKLDYSLVLTEVGKSIDLNEEKYLNSLMSLTENDLKKEVSRSVRKLQTELRSDVTGFGEAFRLKFPGYWKQVVHRWTEIYRTLPVYYDVKVNIRGSALRSKPVKVGD